MFVNGQYAWKLLTVNNMQTHPFFPTKWKKKIDTTNERMREDFS